MDIFQRISEKKARLDAHRPLSESQLQRLKKDLNLEWTYNSNAIEGNTLSLRETQLVLETGITIKGKSLREHFEAKNHENALKELEKAIQSKSPLSEHLIMTLHAQVLNNIEDEFAGRYRNGRVRILGANFTPPNPLKVPDLMEDLVQWANAQENSMDPAKFAAHLHHRFVWIHPFFDGNGRTGRLLMNLKLMQKGFPPAIILKNDRKKYYNALNQANQENYAKLELIVAQAIERSLDLYLEACSSSSDDYLPLSQLAPNTPYSQEYLSLLARQGKIDAIKLGRNWHSTSSAIQNYLDQL